MTQRSPDPRLSGLLLAFLLSFGPAVSNSFARFAYALVLPAMRDDLLLSYSQAGWLNTANALGYLAGAVLTRLWVDRLGNRFLFGAGMILTALAILATGLSRHPDLLSLMRALGGLGGAAVFICGGALSANIMPSQPSMASTTIAVYFAGGGIGLMLCGIAIPLLLDLRGHSAWPLAWQSMGALAIGMTAVSVWAARRIPEPGSSAARSRASIAPLHRALITYLCFGLGYIGYMTFVIAWMRENGASTVTVMSAWTLLGLTTLLAPAVWRKPVEHWAGGRPLAAAMAVLALGAALPLIDASGASLMLSAALFGLAMFSIPSAIQSLVKKGIPMPAWGSAMASFTIVFAAGQVAGPLAAGWLADLMGSLRPGLAVSALLLLGGAALALRQPEQLAHDKDRTHARSAHP